MRIVSTLPIVPIDFDGTAADTFTPSPRGRGVEAGYRHGLGEIFGNAELLDIIGGLRNRAPTEVIVAVLAHDAKLRELGIAYYEKNRKRLSGLVPQGKGMQSPRPSHIEVLAETLVRVRLDYLMPEISPEWPRPFEGVIECLASLEAQGIKTAIVSSGHTCFIEKTFNAWGARCPSIIVTDDDMRALGLSPEKCCKPNRLLLDMMLIQAQQYVLKDKGRMSSIDVRAYIGDSEEKDGALAQNAGVRFGWFNPRRRATTQGFGNNRFTFSSWHELDSML